MTTKIAIITGAGSGIGRAVALGLFAAGYRIALSGRRVEALEETVAKAKVPAEKALMVPGDLTDAAAVVDLFDQTAQHFGRLDLLFNNAGTFGPGGTPLEGLTVEQWRAVVDINLTAPFLCTQQAFRLMKAQDPQGGRIINNGSISAHAPRPHSPPNTATKHAITGLTKSTALDGRRYNIACGQIDIGNASTDMTSQMSTGVPQADGRTAPEPTMGVEHVVQGVLYMASLPLEANVQFMTVMATKMPYVGRG
ncbi:MAG: SDR family oxidoreductase [Candidatus Competibacterales bacterium]